MSGSPALPEAALDELDALLASPVDRLVGTPERQPIPGGVRVTVQWRDELHDTPAGQLKIDILGREVRFQSLRLTPDWQRCGVYTALCSTLPAWALSWRLERFTAVGATYDQAAVLERGGFTRDGLMLDLTLAADDRMNEYAAWKGGGVDEPAWHRALARE